MIIGITGKSGVGKSTYARYIAEEDGFFVVHIDTVSHRILNLPAYKAKLRDMFGNEIVGKSVDRKRLGDLIFTNRHLYKELSELIWKEMKNQIDYILSKHENVILDWILLPHTHYWKMCDKKILIVADEDERKRKVMARDNISAEYLNKRDAASINYDNIEFDEVIENKYTSKGES